MTSPHPGQVLTRSLSICLILATSMVPPAYACGLNSPATPVPQFRDGVELWPKVNGETVFRPGLPGQQLPDSRDTTDRFGGLSVPNAANSHELFKSVDIVDDTLFVAYSLGIQAWDIGSGSEEDPRKLAFKDLWKAGDYLIPAPSTSEQLNFISDIAAVKSSGGTIMVGVAGKMPFVGPTIWTYDRNNHFQLKYQDAGNGVSGGTNALQVRMEEVGGRVYMITTGSDGVVLHDATSAALLTRCLDDQGSNCPGVFKGLIPNSRARYIDTAVIDGRLYIAMSGGNDGTKIFELTPSLGAPLSAADAVTRYSSGDFANGPALFQHRGTWWLATVALTKVQIFDIDDCVDGNGCGSLSLEWEAPDPVIFFGEQFLTFSRAAGNRPFLYYGIGAFNVDGPAIERLFDLDSLGASNNITEITSTGGTYFDDCGNQVDYWGEYYGENEFGLREMHPKVGKFNDNNFFYRAGQTILDVHVRNPGDVAAPSPEVTAAATNPAPYYQGDAIPFSATAENCDGPDTWEWFSSDVGATGTGMAGATRSLTFPLCGDATCPSRSVDVWAIKDACSTAGDLEIVEDTISVDDPRARFNTIDSTPAGDTHPVCTVFEFTADVTGRAPFTYAWEAMREDGSMLAMGSSPTFMFDTSEVALGPEIFADGFESGTTTQWGSQASSRKGAAAADIPVDVRLRVSNADDPTGDVVTRRITLTELGTLTLDSPGISSTDNGSASFDFTMNSNNATEWRWIFEDPENGEETDCDSPSISRCTILDWGTEDSTASYQWITPNTDGTYDVIAQARNCRGDNVEATLPVSVTDIQAPAAPELTSFRVDVAASSGCTASLGFIDCKANQSVTFTVATEGSPTSVQFDWDGDGNWDSTFPTPGPFSHTYSMTGGVAPKAQAIRGGELSAIRSLDNGSFGTLNIIP